VNRPQRVLGWVAAGAVALGLGVALVDGAATAAADTGSQSASSTHSSAQHSSDAPAKKRPAKPDKPAKPTKPDKPPKPDKPDQPAKPDKPVERATPTRAAATGAAQPSGSPLDDLGRQLQYIFANKAPTVQAGAQEQNSDGTVAGSVVGQSNNGFGLRYSVGQAPEHGSVVVDTSTGAYTYTPTAGLPASTTVDEFTIVADNGVAARLPGILGGVQNVLHAVAVAVGASGRDTDVLDVAVSLTGQTTFGDIPVDTSPTAVTARIVGNRTQYWLADSAQNSALAAVGMVIGQQTGRMPSMADMKKEAGKTLSVVLWEYNPQTGNRRNPRVMYRPGQERNNSWVQFADGNELLHNHGLVVTGSYYDQRTGKDDALANLTTALRQGKSVIVYSSVDAYSAYTDEVGTFKVAVTVLGVDFSKQRVYVNNGALPNGGRNMSMSMDDFVEAWGPTYETVVAERPAS
jgi:hypothetical protein